ncbi:MAG: flagellar type III secretion system pore protein FliP [Bacillota bacterium]
MVWAVCAVLAGPALAEPVSLPSVNLQVGTTTEPAGVVTTLQILALLTVLSLAPGIVMLMTSFTRLVVTLSFLRSGLGTQQVPPNQVLVALALFLTFFVMSPVWAQVQSQALEPYLAGELDQEAAFSRAMAPVRDFMLRQTRERDLALFMSIAGHPQPRTPDDVPTSALIPAFAISELKTAFQIGFIIFIPFLVIDMVVASTLMSMGMLMLPPVMISLPFKILLFVLVDGWNLMIMSLISSFR